MKTPSKHMYICEKAPSFKIRLKDGPPEVYANFENGVWNTDDDELGAAFDLALEKPHISALVKKVNWARAQAVVDKALATRAEQTGTVKGPVTAFALSARKTAALEEDTRTNLQNAGLDTAAADKVIEELKSQGLTTTKKTDAEIIAEQAAASDANPERASVADAKKATAAARMVFSTKATNG